MENKAFQLQQQIRQNAEEVSSYLSDMIKWEKEVDQKDSRMRKKKIGSSSPGASSSSVPTSTASSSSSVRQGAGTITVQMNSPAISSVLTKATSAASHTYDVGYKKWEQFQESSADNETAAKQNQEAETETTAVGPSATLTPATLVQRTASTLVAPPPSSVPRALGTAYQGDAELREREQGNEAFKLGDFALAVKAYTKCIGMKVRNHVAFSNRAMAYLKLKEYVRAEADTCCALHIDPTHVKSLLRRSTARTALGKHRAALQDLLQADELDPSSKSTKGEIGKVREVLRSAVGRAPAVKVTVQLQDDPELAVATEGPEMR